MLIRIPSEWKLIKQPFLRVSCQKLAFPWYRNEKNYFLFLTQHVFVRLHSVGGFLNQTQEPIHTEI